METGSQHPILSLAAVSMVLFSTAFGITTAILRARQEREAAEAVFRARLHAAHRGA